jgi:hypothetical protein
LKSEIYATLVRAGAIRLRPGVARLLHDLRAQGIRLAIATTTTPSSLDSLLLAHFGDEAASLFEVFGAGDVVRHKKPAPDIYLLGSAADESVAAGVSGGRGFAGRAGCGDGRWSAHADYGQRLYCKRGFHRRAGGGLGPRRNWRAGTLAGRTSTRRRSALISPNCASGSAAHTRTLTAPPAPSLLHT